MPLSTAEFPQVAGGVGRRLRTLDILPVLCFSVMIYELAADRLDTTLRCLDILKAALGVFNLVPPHLLCLKAELKPYILLI